MTQAFAAGRFRRPTVAAALLAPLSALLLSGALAPAAQAAPASRALAFFDGPGGSDPGGNDPGVSEPGFDEPAAPPRRRARREKLQPSRAASPLPARAKAPVLIVVSTNSQRLSVYEGDQLVASATVSTGIDTNPTPHGVFSIIDKRAYHESNIYSSAPMPWMQRLTWSGIALHEGRVTGAPASHGCVRLPAAFAKSLFRYTRPGARVVIAREEVSPGPVYGALPFDVGGPRRAAPETAPTAVSSPVAAPDEAAGELPGEIAASAPLARGARPDERSPVAILVSRKAGKIYVRRGFRPLFEAPIGIEAPQAPLGLHLLVARAGYGDELAWSALAVPGRGGFDAGGRIAGSGDGFVDILAEPRANGRSRRARFASASSRIETEAPAYDSLSTTDALRRLKLAPGVAARISALVGPGASLILSDDGARGREDWNGTDFIALTD